MMKIFTAFLLFLSTFINAQDFWVQTNGPYEQAMLIKSTNNNNSYYAMSRHGLFSTNKSGGDWTYINTDFNYEYMVDFAADGNGLILLYSYAEGGLMISHDEGINWQNLSSFYHNGTVRIFLDSQNSIYVSNSNFVKWNYQFGMWDTISHQSLQDFKEYKGKSYALVDDKILFSDNGENWITFIDTIPDFGLAAFIRLEIIDENNFLVKDNYAKLYYIKKNESSLTISLILDYVTNYQVLSNSGIAASVGNSLFLSNNIGASWEKNFEIELDEIFNLLAEKNGNIYAGESNHGYYSNDYGKTWRDYGIPAAEICDLTSFNNILFSIARDGSFAFSSDKGESWIIPKVFPTHSISGVMAINEYTLILSYSDGIYRTTDRGETWQHVNTPISGPAFQVNDITFSKSGKTYLTSSGDVLVSPDSGLTWERHFSDLFIGSNSSIYVDENENVFLGDQENIYLSTDEGITWEIIKKFSQAFPIASMITNNQGDLFVGTRGGGLFRSTDNFTTFDQIFFGDNFNKINSLLVDKLGIIYAAKENEGIYKSSDNGDSWTQLGSGLRKISSIFLTIDNDGFLYVGTKGSSVYRSHSSVTNLNPDIINNLNTFSLSQNFPNPFNPVTKIKYNIPDREGYTNVSLKVYDMLGKEIITLVNEEKAAGEYEIDFDAKNLASGIYFYKIQANDFIESKKMILLK